MDRVVFWRAVTGGGREVRRSTNVLENWKPSLGRDGLSRSVGVFGSR